MKSILPFFALAIVLVSCTLNAEQETSLNQHLGKYIKAKNNCMLVGIIGFTYPQYVRELKEQGDSIFLQTIDCTQDNKNKQLYDPIIRSSAKDGNNIHVYCELKIEATKNEKSTEELYKTIAISEDKGKTWYFIPFEVYQDKQHCKAMKRLINF
ncbi:MAG: hypothetical protein M9916_12535 [Crocinitomicaceae bacterium]|nr:hypothetical protein [Crocinitomicaceae bacterium]